MLLPFEVGRGDRLRDDACAFVARHRWIAVIELFIVAVLFTLPLFRFSSGVLTLPFVLLATWLRQSSVRDLGLRRPHSWKRAILWGLAAVAIILTIQALLVQPLLQRLFDRPPDYTRFQQMTVPRLLGWIAAGWVMGGLTEEIIRAYLIYRIVDLVGTTRAGWTAAVLGSSGFYALNHSYLAFPAHWEPS